MAMPRHHCLYMARLAEQAERYEDMAEFMSKIIVMVSPANLALEERALFVKAYKEVVGSLREACRVAASNEKKELAQVEWDRARIARAYGSMAGSRLAEVCAVVLDLLETHLIPGALESEAKVYYRKMKGDYYRYLAEVKSGDERSVAVENALQAYKAAHDIAEAELAPTHPTRLGLAVNFSVFYYEILNLSNLAFSMAKEAFEDAMAEIDNNEESYKDSTVILQLIRDNYIFWASNLRSDYYS